MLFQNKFKIKVWLNCRVVVLFSIEFYKKVFSIEKFIETFAKINSNFIVYSIESLIEFYGNLYRTTPK